MAANSYITVRCLGCKKVHLMVNPGGYLLTDSPQITEWKVSYCPNCGGMYARFG